MANTFTFAKEYGELAEFLSTEEQNEFYLAICRYGLLGVEPTLEPKLLALFNVAKLGIDKSVSNHQRTQAAHDARRKSDNAQCDNAQCDNAQCDNAQCDKKNKEKKEKKEKNQKKETESKEKLCVNNNNKLNNNIYINNKYNNNNNKSNKLIKSNNSNKIDNLTSNKADTPRPNLGEQFDNLTNSKARPANLEEVQIYIDQRGIKSFTANEWWDFYSSKGWKIGRDSMKDWKAAIRTWEHRKDTPTTQSTERTQEDDFDILARGQVPNMR